MTQLVKNPTAAHRNGTVVSVISPSDAGRWIVSLIDSNSGIFILCGGHGRESAVDAVAYAPNVPGMASKPIRTIQWPDMGGIDAAVLAIWLTRNYRSSNLLDSLVIDREAAHKDLAAILHNDAPCELSNKTLKCVNHPIAVVTE